MCKITALLVKYGELLRHNNFPFYSTDMFVITQFGFITKHHNSMKTDYILIFSVTETNTSPLTNNATLFESKAKNSNVNMRSRKVKKWFSFLLSMDNFRRIPSSSNTSGFHRCYVCMYISMFVQLKTDIVNHPYFLSPFLYSMIRISIKAIYLAIHSRISYRTITISRIVHSHL